MYQNEPKLIKNKINNNTEITISIGILEKRNFTMILYLQDKCHIN